MRNVSVARRYARALLEASAGQSDEALAALTTWAGMVEGSSEFADVTNNPAYSRAQRHALVDGLLKVAPAPASVVNLLKLLTDRSRLNSIPDIARQFQGMVDARLGRVRATVTSAKPLGDAALKALETKLAQVTNSSVSLEAATDPSLLGGVKAQVGSVVYDGTLRAQLDDMKRALTR